MTSTDGTDPERERLAAIRRLWSDGAYERVGAMFAPATDALVAELDVGGRRVLDAATGTGNTALAAARAGASVAAFDLTPRLLDVARARAAEDGLDIDWREGDLLAIPWPDDAFDDVISTFGAFTADDPPACAAELVRVCRPGGRVVTTAWGTEGIFGVLTALVGERHLELMPPTSADPRAWADADGLAGIFGDLDVAIALEHRTAWFPFASAEEALRLFEDASGPLQRLRGAVRAEGGEEWDALRAELVARWAASARPAGSGVELPAVYGVATITVGQGG